MSTAERCDEIAIDVRCRLGESPVWDQDKRQLIWVDIRNATLHRWSSDNGDTAMFEIGHALSAVAPRRSGGYVVATRLGFGAVDDTGNFQLLAPVEDDLPENRMNDGKCDPKGRFYAGTMSEHDEPGAGSLYRLDTEGRVTRLFGGVTISNGLDWSPDGRSMYYVDTLAYGIDVLEVLDDAGNLGERQRLVDIDPEIGAPDGLAVDEEGCLWLALHSGHAVHCYSPSGELLRRIELPVALVTSCAFGGPDLTDLYITTAIRHDESEPLAGAVFRYEAGVRGFPGRFFEG